MANMEKKSGEDGNTKNLKNEMSFLDQLKACFFHNYLKLVSAIFIKFLFFFTKW